MSNADQSPVKPNHKKGDDDQMHCFSILPVHKDQIEKAVMHFWSTLEIAPLLDCEKMLRLSYCFEPSAINRLIWGDLQIEARSRDDCADPDSVRSIDELGWSGEKIKGSPLPKAAMGDDEMLFHMPDADFRNLLPLCMDNGDLIDQDALNDFWLALGAKLGFCWTTVRGLDYAGDGRMTFIAEPEGVIMAGEAITLDVDPARDWLASYVGRQDPKTMRFSDNELLLAFAAGMNANAPMEFEIDGAMMPAEQAVEALLARHDDIQNVIRDVRDSLFWALEADDDAAFAGLTVDGEGVE